MSTVIAVRRPRAAIFLAIGTLALPLALVTSDKAGAGVIAPRVFLNSNVQRSVGRRPMPNLHGLARPFAATRVRMSPAAAAASASFCNRIWTDNSKAPPAGAIGASAGAIGYCFGPQFNQGNGASVRRNVPLASSYTIGRNVDAANPNEDITQSGVRGYGQSETSSAAIDNFVVEAWNDSTAFFAACSDSNNKAEATGFGFSNNNGASFIDLGGLPNSACASSRYGGDPGVEAYRGTDGSDYFYVTSIFTTTTAADIALAACKVNGIGHGAFLTCSDPIVVASTPLNSGFLDKPYVTIDQPRGKLYVSYTNFTFTGTGNGQIELATCDLTGTPGAPTCSGAPTAIVAPEGNCVNQGSYPAADPASGDVYVVYEFNYVSNQSSFNACNTFPTQEVTTRVPFGAGGPVAAAAVNITSMDTAFVPGYNRFPLNDFPRIAVSDPYGSVSITWNDGRFRPTGDILLQSYALGSGFPTTIQHTKGCTSSSCPNPVRLSNNTSPTFDILPALRNSEPDGGIDVTWYDKRRSPKTDRSFTDVYGALNISPGITHSPSNKRITNVGSSWFGVSSDIVPNFGDYTDNHVKESPNGPTYTVDNLFVAWSDGRIGEPQPFSALVTGI